MLLPGLGNQNSDGGSAIYEVTSLQPDPAGERHNDDFLLHYGFVPPGNPHDDVLLFPSLEAALEWYFDRAVPQVRGGSAKLTEKRC